MAMEIDSKYRKILLAAKRAKQLMKGARPRVDPAGHKQTRVALNEIERGLIQFDVGQRKDKNHE
ncbi:MAG: DNA-directed RNA polymerase subunit omega [Blastocatellia bacterium]